MATPMNAAEVLADWTAKTKAAAGTKFKNAIGRVQVSPTALAAAKVSEYAAGCQRAATDGSFAAGCNKVSLQEWQRVTSTKGAQNISSGVDAAQQKMATHLQAALPFAAQLKEKIRAMPKGGEANAMERFRTAMQDTIQFYKNRKGIS